MKNYKVITGKIPALEQEVATLLADGWELIGGVTSVQKGSVVEYAQSLAKDIEVAVKPVVKKRASRAKTKEA